MADKRISQLIERVDIANNDVLPIVASGAVTTNKVTISTIQDWMQENLDVGVTSVGITIGSTGTDVNVTGSPITSSGNITINIPDASASARGLVTTGAQIFAGDKTFNDTIIAADDIRLVSKGTALQTFITNSAGDYTGYANANSTGFNLRNNTYVFSQGKQGYELDFDNSQFRFYTLPDADGTIALTSQLDGFVTLDTAQTITAQKTFTTSGSSDTMIISHGSGNGFALDVIKAGNNEAIRVTKTSGSGNAMSITGGNFSAEDATFSSDIVVNGVNVGRGAGSVASNTRLGNASLGANTTGSSNTAIGADALENNTTGSNNTAVGENALKNNLVGVWNTAIGFNSLLQNTNSSNTAIGYNSLLNNTTGDANFAAGRGALELNTTGRLNTSVGFFSLNANTTGSFNVAVGDDAGRFFLGSGNQNVITNNSVFIGSQTRALGNDQTNQIVIGYQAIGNGSNTVTIGNDSITSNIFSGNLTTRRAVGTASEGIIELRPNTGSSNIIIASGAVPLHILSTSGSLGLGVGSTPQVTIASGGAVTLTGALNGTSATFAGRARFQGTGFDTLGSAEIMLTNTTASTGRSFIVNSSNAGEFLISDVSAGQTRLSINSSGAVTLTGALNGTSASFSETFCEVRSLSTTTSDYANFIVDTNNNTNYRLQMVGFGTTASGTLAGISRAGNGFVVKSGGLLAIGTRDLHDLVLSTNEIERLRISSTGAATFSSSVGVAGSPVSSAALTITAGTSVAAYWKATNTNAAARDWTIITNNANFGDFAIRQGNSQGADATSGTDRLTILAGGNVGIGTASPAANLDVQAARTANLTLLKLGTNNASTGNGDKVNIDFYSDGNNYLNSRISREIESFATYAGALTFSTGASNSVTERIRITSGGSFLVQKQAANNTDTGIGWFVNDYFCATNNSSDSGDRVVLINRQNSDGELIEFRQGNVAEGDITVTGTTVSYNGGHLSRYSQMESNEIIEGLLKGTVMSNLDKMAEWINPETGEPYPNEQLNCMKISDVEGDKNVAGVFVNWQYDSELLTNDMNIAMTGDMIIRIAEGVVVEKGDLLISAGDGTAKPQIDDLIRSNTIAKVISNHVTCVYEDGSYCVPCVLMAC